MDVLKIKSKEEFKNYCKQYFDDFYATYKMGYYIPGFPTFDLYKGIDCTHYLECGSKEESMISSLYYILRQDGDITDKDKTAMFHLNEKEFGICSSDKYLWIDFLSHTIHMKQMTAGGVYELLLCAKTEYNGFLDRLSFHSNEDILKYAKEYGLTEEQIELYSEIIKFKFAHDNEYLGISFPNRFGNLPQPKLNLSKDRPTDEFVLLANKIYRNGLIYVAELAKNGGLLEIDDEDRKFFEASSEEMKKPDSPMEKDTMTIKDDNNSIILDLDKTIQSLRYLLSMGFELTDEQKNLIEIFIGKLNPQKFAWYYDKLKSEELKKYIEDAPKREERLQKVREQIAKDEAIKELWYHSPENPSNIRGKQIQTMQEQLNALNNLRKYMPLNESQEDLRKKLEIFFDMKAKADAEDHMLDSSMSSEVRDWYQNEYFSQETGRKTK